MKPKTKMKMIGVLLPQTYIKGLDKLVENKYYPSRADAIRTAVLDVLKEKLWLKEKERYIDE